MKVELVAHTRIAEGFDAHPYKYHILPVESDADEVAEMAGRGCYQSWERPNAATATNKGYLGNILAHSHFSVLEHASASLRISGVSRSLTHELVRHRHLSVSQVSQRYVDEGNAKHVINPAVPWDAVMYPDAMENGDLTVKDEYDSVMEICLDSYRRLVDRLVTLGLDRKAARGAARGVLPNMTTTSLIVSGNHRAWREMLSKRLAPGADAEIRELAGLILSVLREIAPNTYQDFERGK